MQGTRCGTSATPATRCRARTRSPASLAPSCSSRVRSPRAKVREPSRGVRGPHGTPHARRGGGGGLPCVGLASPSLWAPSPCSHRPLRTEAPASLSAEQKPHQPRGLGGFRHTAAGAAIRVHRESRVPRLRFPSIHLSLSLGILTISGLSEGIALRLPRAPAVWCVHNSLVLTVTCRHAATSVNHTFLCGMSLRAWARHRDRDDAQEHSEG